MLPNLNALRIFAAVARHGSMVRAAEALNLTHGAVSQRIRQLEGELGVALFVRQARGVTLTAEGERCHAAVEEALAILETAFSGIGGRPGRVVLHLGASFATKWLMPRMAAFAEALPDIALETETHERPLQRNLGRHEIAVWPGARAEANRAHEVRQLTGLRMAAVCAPVLAEGVDTLAQVLALPLLQDAHRRWERLISQTGEPGPHRVLNFDRSALALEAAAGGHGVAIAPEHLFASDVAAGRLVEVWALEGASGEYVYAAWARDADPVTLRVAEWLEAQFAK